MIINILQSFTRKTSYETRSLTSLFLILELIKRDREFVSPQNENVLFQVQFFPSYIFANITVRYRSISHSLAD